MVIPVLAMDAVPALAMVAISDVVLVLAITDVAQALVTTGVTTDAALALVTTDAVLALVTTGVVLAPVTTDTILVPVTTDTILVPVTMDIGAAIGDLIIMVMTVVAGVAIRRVRLYWVWRSVPLLERRLSTPIRVGKSGFPLSWE